ncbi:MAG: hypothetical protein IRZ04_02750 [Rhodospirillales bacterium]|nr:hypothetical protein [Rhodospirillales bacterium]
MRIVFLVAALAALAAPPALATSAAGKAAQARWDRADACAKMSFERFPDWTKEHAAKREAFVRKCHADKRLPQRAPVGAKE